MKINLTTATPNFKSLFKLPVDTPKGDLNDIEFPELSGNRPRIIGDAAYYLCLNQADQVFLNSLKKNSGIKPEQIESKKLHESANFANVVNALLEIQKGRDILTFYWHDLSLLWQNASKYKKVHFKDIKGSNATIKLEEIEDRHILSFMLNERITEKGE